MDDRMDPMDEEHDTARALPTPFTPDVFVWGWLSDVPAASSSVSIEDTDGPGEGGDTSAIDLLLLFTSIESIESVGPSRNFDDPRRACGAGAVEEEATIGMSCLLDCLYPVYFKLESVRLFLPPRAPYNTPSTATK